MAESVSSQSFTFEKKGHEQMNTYSKCGNFLAVIGVKPMSPFDVMPTAIWKYRWILFMIMTALGWNLGPNAISVRAQVEDPLVSLGVPTFPMQIPVESGYISPSEGNLHLEIPLGTFKQRGGRQFKLSLQSNSNFWTINTFGGVYWAPQNPLGTGPWSLYMSLSGGGASFNDVTTGNPCTLNGSPPYPKYDTYTAFMWNSPDGSEHAFPIKTIQGYTSLCGDWTGSSVPTGDALATDGSGYHMYVTNFINAAVYAPDGTYYGSNEDANGNYVGTSNGYQDTLGRTLWTSSSNPTGTVQTYSVLNESGGTSSYVVTYVSIPVSTNFQSAGSTAGEWPGFYQQGKVIGVIQSIQLPDGTSYSFLYDCDSSTGNPACNSPAGQSGYYGQITRMTLPTQGQITYKYANFDDSEYSQHGKHVSRGITSRTTPDGTWNYQYQVTLQCIAVGAYPCRQQLTETKPSGDNTIYKFNINGSAWPVEVDYYSGTSTLLATQVQSFDYTQPCSPAAGCIAFRFYGATNVTKLSATTTLVVPGGSAYNETTQFCYDPQLGNLRARWEWANFYTGAVYHDPNPPSSLCSIYSGVPAPDRTTTYTYLSGASYANANANISNRATSIVVTGSGSNIISQTANSYDDWNVSTGPTGVANHDDAKFGQSNNIRGNLTQSKRWLNTSNSWLVTKNYYDLVGNLIQTTDPNSNNTYFDYTDDFYSVTPPKPTNAYLTKVTKPVTNGVNHITRSQYYWGSAPSAECGENFPIASTCAYGLSAPQPDYNSYTYDNLNRSLTINMGDGGQTSWSYGTSPSTSTSTTKIDGSHSLVREIILDGLGRKSKTQTSSGQGTIYVDTAYDSNGRVHTISNPHFSGSSSTDGVTTYTSHDGLDRVLVITEQDGSAVTTSYSGNCKTVTDEASKARKFCYDGFGRITRVWEDPSSLDYETDYQYNLLDDLLSVTQSGSQQRNFAYDSLSHLTQATNPESGTINYTYDANGNVLTKIDARNITTTYSYDALNRLTQKSYSDGTPLVTMNYDVKPSWYGQNNLTNLVGRLVEAISYSSATGQADTVSGYDPMGRVALQWQQTPPAWPGGYFSYFTYDLAGDLIQLTYPSGRVVKTQYNAPAQPIQVWFDNFNGTPIGYNYLSSANYAPTGAPTSLTLGSGVIESATYNNRLQPCNLQLVSGSFTWLNRTNSFYPTAGCQGSGGNNGNVMSIADSLQANRTQTFGYDNLNRISTAQSAATSGPDCWGQSFGYDAWANLLAENVTKCSGTQLSVGVNTQNRITNSGISYDAAGNMLTDGINTYTYDAESRISTLNGTGTTYTYGADGQRVLKQIGSDATEYVYSNGQVIAERKPSGDWSDYIYAGSRRLARGDNYEDRLAIGGTNCSNCGWQYSTFDFPNSAGLNGYTIQSGDILIWRQWQPAGVQGGLTFLISSGVDTNWITYDQDGQMINSDTTVNWHYRRVDLSNWVGNTITALRAVADVRTAAGPWAIVYNEIVLVSSDGTLRPIYVRQPTISLTAGGSSGVTGRNYTVQHVPASWDGYTLANTYYHGDHLGSARLMSTYYGYPVWSSTFLPFGQEWNPQPTVNHYKFTGKERDSESGLDNFGARYDSSQYGRFMTPDWSDDPDPVPYADFTDPQTLNLYAYVRNNPLSNTDDDGHDRCDGATGGTPEECQNNHGQWIPGNVPRSSQPTTNSPQGGDLSWQQINLGVRNFTNLATQVTNQVVNFLTAPRNPGCMANATTAGSEIGAGIGLLGLATGPGAAVIDPTTTVIGGGAGFAVGIVSCMSGTGGGGGKAGGHREKTRGANAKDRENIRSVAREAGIDVREFGDYVEKLKGSEGRGGSDNYTFGELQQLADQFKAGDR